MNESDRAMAFQAPGSRRIALRISPEAERAIRRGHPWVFDRAIRRQSHQGLPGDLAVIFDRKDRFLAIGLYDPTSPIRVRILHHGTSTPIDQTWLRRQVATAVGRRAALSETSTTGYRAVHGENDGLPGLIVDRYEDSLVIKLYTPAWAPHLPQIQSTLDLCIPNRRQVLRLNRALQHQTDSLLDLEDGQVLKGPPITGPALFQENGLRFEADLQHGQKTGFFLDQRDNRRRVQDLSAGKEVLNVFAYTGGFSLYAARGGARSVTSIDLNQLALDGAERNFALNSQVPAVRQARHAIIAGDAFQVLASLAASGRRFDLVILDPPAFAQRRDQVDGALRAYSRLTRLALGVLEPGGTLVQASCSSRVTQEAFVATIQETVEQEQWRLHGITLSGHPLDHPIGFPEGAYLKCLFAAAAPS
ncbi:MAG: class I SAM-dependent rRNA methyltransferase [Chloroflexota bacterium]|nr:class I SAM-dependent rRNA methyltransferase [Chloroflexota bacterium]